jgi:hypothetical protein
MLLGSLASMLTGVQSQSNELKAVYEPKCSEDHIMGDTDACQTCVDNLFKMTGGVGTKRQGCTTVVQEKGCRIDLCDINSDSTVDYIAIAEAAQITIAACRTHDETITGGKSIVEGFEQRGQGHSVATVYVNNDNNFVTPNHPRDFHTRNIKSKPTKRTPGDEEWTTIRPGYRVVESYIYRDDPTPYNYFIIAHTQSKCCSFTRVALAFAKTIILEN